MTGAAIAAVLEDGRLHLQHGPIDLIIDAKGDNCGVDDGFSERLFDPRPLIPIAGKGAAGLLNGFCASQRRGPVSKGKEVCLDLE